MLEKSHKLIIKKTEKVEVVRSMRLSCGVLVNLKRDQGPYHSSFGNTKEFLANSSVKT
jgi:hypothetical protein